MGVPGGNGSSLSHAAPTGATWPGQEEPLQAGAGCQVGASSSVQRLLHRLLEHPHTWGVGAVTQESGPRDRKSRLQTQPGSANGSRSEL